jgi:glycosyltransferase involved in cell wall biosynthesis
VKVVISVGGRFHAIQLAEQLHARGQLERIITTKSWYVRSLFPSRMWTAIPAPEYLGMLVRAIPLLRRRGWYSYVKDNLFDALARKYIPACDVFHAWGNYALISMPYARQRGAAVIIERGSTHPYYQDAILREEYERFGIQAERAHPQIIEKGLREIELADRVIIPSDFVRRTFVAQGFPAEKLAVIPYGFNPAHFHAGDKRDEVFRVLFVGNISVQKGVHYLLEAWERLRLRNAELVFIGTVEQELKPLLQRHASHITLRGHVKHEELHREYAQASVFVLPSLQEGSALVTYEAMACGLPLLVSENTGSIARDGDHGFVVPIRDADALAEKLLWLYDHPEEARGMGLRGREYAQQFTWSRYAGEVMDVYRAVLAEREGVE